MVEHNETLCCTPTGCEVFTRQVRALGHRVQSVSKMEEVFDGAMREAGTCKEHGLDFPVRIPRTMPFTDGSKDTKPYYTSEEKARASRSTARKSKQKAPISRHRSELENELGELYDVHRWFAAQHNYLVEIDKGSCTPNPPPTLVWKSEPRRSMIQRGRAGVDIHGDFCHNKRQG